MWKLLTIMLLYATRKFNRVYNVQGTLIIDSRNVFLSKIISYVGTIVVISPLLVN